MIKSPNDPKHYHTETLSNGLRVVVVQNTLSTQAAAAIAVNVGHFDDPKDRQGLAHFLEHMLFLGTEQFPESHEFHQFIKQHGGHNNAWTGTEHTCFFFDINHQALEHALIRFSDFFKSPLLAERYIASERQNVDAEYKLKLKDEIRRLYDVHKATVNPHHPFSQFSVGNLSTLADRNGQSVRQELVDFFKLNYQANYMTLAVESPFPIEQTLAWVKHHFSDIPTNRQPKPAINQPLYLPQHLTIAIDVVPLKQERKLILSFALPAIDQYYQDKPETILSYLLGHEGKGSIYATLQSHGWAVALNAGSGINGSNFKDFNIAITLTAQGEQHIDEIIQLVFQYIELINPYKLPQFYFDEKQAIATLSFLYQETLAPIDSVSQLVINMQHYPDEHIILGDFIMSSFHRDAIATLLSYFTLDNLRIIHISPDVEAQTLSPWYHVPYTVKPLKTSSKAQKWSSLALPQQNPYIASNPTIFPAEKPHQKVPESIVKQNGFTVWYKQDNTFNVPKGYVYIGIDAPIAISSIEHCVMTRLFVECLALAIVEQFYDAELAGIHYHFYAHQGGLSIQVSGISEHQEQFLAQLLPTIINTPITQAQMNILQQQLQHYWLNAAKSKSISQLFATLSSSLQPHNPSYQAQADAIARISYQQFSTFYPSLFQEIAVDVLIHGNWQRQHADSIAHIIEQQLAPFCDQQNKVDCPVVNLENKGELLLSQLIPEHDYASVLYFPFPRRELKIEALCILLSQLLSPPFFHQMRTEKQFGYLVGIGYVPINRYPGLAFYIQSPHTTPDILTAEMEAFINQSIHEITNISTKQWQQLLHSLASQLSEKDTNLGIKSQRFWSAICNNDMAFDHKEHLITAVLSLTPQDTIAFISDFLLGEAQSADSITLISIKSPDESQNERLKSKRQIKPEDLLNWPSH